MIYDNIRDTRPRCTENNNIESSKLKFAMILKDNNKHTSFTCSSNFLVAFFNPSVGLTLENTKNYTIYNICLQQHSLWYQSYI